MQWNEAKNTTAITPLGIIRPHRSSNTGVVVKQNVRQLLSTSCAHSTYTTTETVYHRNTHPCSVVADDHFSTATVHFARVGTSAVEWSSWETRTKPLSLLTKATESHQTDSQWRLGWPLCGVRARAVLPWRNDVVQDADDSRVIGVGTRLSGRKREQQPASDGERVREGRLND